ncbi:hypothetical protein AR158_c218R [Paramecium bursaria Chlorella virus AR158]|uniref:hypothetical protein n=1 Tax=Paramecium bursaria Chlorella virus AR158 TaxID=380598 RepID=UPI00015AA876|nr:hypothetical protein AR158_c218R [Paramecium bursaria Chlorella virus AR158]ABU43764.1 hypothetical protein AR158_c218R [Paramecium bursaria Chlorella virus AR158]
MFRSGFFEFFQKRTVDDTRIFHGIRTRQQRCEKKMILIFRNAIFHAFDMIAYGIYSHRIFLCEIHSISSRRICHRHESRSIYI